MCCLYIKHNKAPLANKYSIEKVVSIVKKYSKSPITGENYLIPQSNDRSALSLFLGKNRARELIAVQGLGFVGTVMSLVVANSDGDQYAVVGVDQATSNSYWKIGDINSGVLPVVSSDPLVEEFFKESKKYCKIRYVINHISTLIKGTKCAQPPHTDFLGRVRRMKMHSFRIAPIFVKPYVLLRRL